MGSLLENVKVAKDNPLPGYFPDTYLEKRNFKCLHCGKETTHYIYIRSSPFYLDCECGQYFFFDFNTESFIGKQMEFNLSDE